MNYKSPMGWNSWNTFGSHINEKLIMEITDRLVSEGYQEAGYEYVIIDDCWSLRERVDGKLVADPELFPNGMKALADYVHSKGLKFGMYSCAGFKTCAGYPSSYGHEFEDAKQFAEWGVRCFFSSSISEGAGRVWVVGSQVDDEKYAKIMEFLDWYASPEGLMFQHSGIEGFNYEVGEDGKLTQINSNALMDNLNVPEEWGGGGYNDGNNAINQWIVNANSINPLTGETYAVTYWSSYKEETLTDMKKEWRERFDAEEPADYMKKNNKLVISPNVSVSLPTDTADISVIRNQCNETVCDYSWRMIYASDDANFDALWDEMSKTLDGYGFQDLVKFDTDKYQIELDAKNAVAAK